MNEDDPVLAYLQQYGGSGDDPVAAYLSRYGEQPKPPGRLESFGRGVAQGATLGFADELSAGVRAAGTLLPGGRPAGEFGEAFSENVEGSRARDDAAREAHGGLMLTGELAGAVAPALVGGAGALAFRGGVRGATTAARGASTVGRLAASGAGLGALEATGRAEGDVVERLPAAAGGAVVGGALGAALPFVGRFASRVGRGLGLTTRRAQTRAADEILDAIDGDVSRITAGATGTPGETAMEAVPSLRNLGEEAYPYRGARETFDDFLKTRAGSQHTRVRQAVEGASGFQRQGAGRVARQIAEERSANAAQAFPRAYARGPVQMTDELATVLSRPSIQRAYAQAAEIAAEQGVPLAPLTNLDVRTLHLLKMGLDDVVSKGKLPGEGGLGPTLTFHYDQTRRGLLAQIRRVAPELSEALDEYAGDTAMKEALELGRTRFHLDPPDELATIMENMTAGEIEMFRRGAVDDLLHRMGQLSDPRTRIRNIVLAPNMQERMGLLFDDPADFMRLMGGLDAQNVTAGSVMRGSPTQRRQVGQEAFEAEAPSFGLRSLFDDFTGAGPRRTESAAAKAEALSPMLTETDLPSLVELLEGRAASRGREALGREALTRTGALGGVTLSDLLLGGEGR